MEVVIANLEGNRRPRGQLITSSDRTSHELSGVQILAVIQLIGYADARFKQSKSRVRTAPDNLHPMAKMWKLSGQLKGIRSFNSSKISLRLLNVMAW